MIKGYRIKARFKRVSSSLLAVALLFGLFAGALPVRAETESNDVIYFDLKAFLGTQPNSQIAYDYLKLATALQGIVNRDTARLFYHFESNSIANSAGVDIDEFWFAELSKPGEVFEGRNVITATSFEQILNTFSHEYAGVAVWDSLVPATSNVVSTAAGVDQLLPVRYDTTAGSPYDLLVNQKGLPIVLDLVGKFTGSGLIPDVNLPSSGSAKNDAYLWAKAVYLDTGRTNPTMMAYHLDGISWNFDTSKSLDAQWVSAAFPARMQAGTSVDVSITVKNSGTTAWTFESNDRLAALNSPANQFVWTNLNGGYSAAPDNQRVFLSAGQPIAPGETHTFAFTIVAPDVPGVYTFNTQMVRDGVAWYGGNLLRSIEVVTDEVTDLPQTETLLSDTYVYPDLFNSLLPNADYYIANKAFFFDLSPDELSLPNDDRSQPLGTDFRTLVSLLQKQNELAGEQIITIGGFVPWWIKYTQHADSQARLMPVAAEWKYADEISKYNAQKDADAYGLIGLSNASAYQHVELDTLVQKNDKGNNGKEYDPDTKYIAFYMGDYDAGAWTAGALPVLWNDPKRGQLPLAWAPVPGLAERVPQVFNYLYETMTPNDYFVAGDNGAGYLNPMMLQEENRPDGLPDFLHVWEAYNQEYYDRHDLDITGFLISGNSGYVNQEIQELYSRFSPAGVGNNAGFEEPIVNGTPFFQVIDVPMAPISTDSAALAQVLTDRLSKNQQFTFYRTILYTPTTIVDAVNLAKANNPEAKFEIVDPYTFYRFYKEARAWEAPSNTYEAQEVIAPIEVDGVASAGEWDGAMSIEISENSQDVLEYGMAWGSTSDLQANYKMKWDSENLYVLEERTDAQFQFTESGPQLYLTDASMLFLDLNGRKFGSRYEAGDYALLFTASSPDGDPKVFVREGRDQGAIEHELTSSSIISTISDQSYVLELAIPWSALQQVPFTAEAGQFIGMSVLATHGPTDWGQIMWSGAGDDQSKWATMKFVGAQALSAPTGVTAVDVSKTTIELAWDAAPVSDGIAFYDIYVDGVFAASVEAPLTAYTLTGLMKNTTYSIALVARRASGAASEASEPLQVTTKRNSGHDPGHGNGNGNGNGHGNGNGQGNGNGHGNGNGNGNSNR